MNDPLHSAMLGLAQAIDAPGTDGAALGSWRWTVRQQMAALRETLAHEPAYAREAWLDARRASMRRERHALLSRMAVLGPQVLTSPELDGVRDELRRLVADVAHHRQRVHDLAYDDVELELGGSE